jgi:hypothetical protein
MNMLAKLEAIAQPRGLATRGWLSGTVGIPAKSAKRTAMGVKFRCVCGARVSEVAFNDG